MNQLEKILSASTDWKAISVVETSTVGDLIHTAPINPSSFDEITLYADNTHDTAVILSLEWGDAALPMEISLAANSWPVKIVDWLILKWNTTPLTIAAFAATTAVVAITGKIVHNFE